MACELHLNKAVINTFKKTSTKIPMNLLGKVRERERHGKHGERGCLGSTGHMRSQPSHLC